jgi:hypothetical protein
MALVDRPFPCVRALLALALSSACVIPQPIGGDADGGSTTPTTETTGDPTLGATSNPSTTGSDTADATGTTDTDPTNTGSSSDSTATTDTGPTPACIGVPAFQCSEPLECFLQSCGELFSPFDADGCMRPPCTVPADCEPGFACLRPQDYGGCASSGLACGDDRNGECQCVSDPDCGGGWCLPADEIPPLECFGLPDAAACLDAGCTEFRTVIEISDTCACTPDVPACLLFPGQVSGAASPDYFWHEATLTVARFGTSWDLLPTGWRRCTDPGAPPACDCYEPFMRPTCP